MGRHSAYGLQLSALRRGKYLMHCVSRDSPTVAAGQQRKRLGHRRSSNGSGSRAGQAFSLMPGSFPKTGNSAEVWGLPSGCNVDSTDLAATSRIRSFKGRVASCRSMAREVGEQLNLCGCAAVGKLCGIRRNRLRHHTRSIAVGRHSTCCQGTLFRNPLASRSAGRRPRSYTKAPG